MREQERFSGRCTCGGILDVPIPSMEGQAQSWLAKHREAGHAPVSETYTQRIGQMDDNRERRA